MVEVGVGEVHMVEVGMVEMDMRVFRIMRLEATDVSATQRVFRLRAELGAEGSQNVENSDGASTGAPQAAAGAATRNSTMWAKARKKMFWQKFLVARYSANAQFSTNRSIRRTVEQDRTLLEVVQRLPSVDLRTAVEGLLNESKHYLDDLETHSKAVKRSLKLAQEACREMQQVDGLNIHPDPWIVSLKKLETRVEHSNLELCQVTMAELMQHVEQLRQFAMTHQQNAKGAHSGKCAVACVVMPHTAEPQAAEARMVAALRGEVQMIGAEMVEVRMVNMDVETETAEVHMVEADMERWTPDMMEVGKVEAGMVEMDLAEVRMVEMDLAEVHMTEVGMVRWICKPDKVEVGMAEAMLQHIGKEVTDSEVTAQVMQQVSSITKSVESLGLFTARILTEARQELLGTVPGMKAPPPVVYSGPGNNFGLDMEDVFTGQKWHSGARVLSKVAISAVPHEKVDFMVATLHTNGTTDTLIVDCCTPRFPGNLEEDMELPTDSSSIYYQVLKKEQCVQKYVDVLKKMILRVFPIKLPKTAALASTGSLCGVVAVCGHIDDLRYLPASDENAPGNP
eukprot:gene5933-7136_t